jgi:signal transduction histidine kinase
MKDLIKSKLFIKQFLAFLIIIFTTFIIISSVLVTTTKTSLEKQQLNTANIHRCNVSRTLKSWIDAKENDIKNHAYLLGKLGKDDLSSPVIKDITTEKLYQDNDYSDIMILDNEGNIINCIHEPSTKNLSDKSFFKDSMNGRTIVTSFDRDLISKAPVIIISTPIYIDEKPKYVLAAVIELEHIKKLMDNMDLSGLSNAYLVDKEGILITSNKFIKDFTNGADLGDNYKISSEAVDNVIDKKEGSEIYKNHEDKMVFGSFEWIDPLNAGLIVEFEENKQMQPINDLIWATKVLSIFVLIIGIFLALILSKKVLKPVNLLIKSTENIIEQNYQEPIDIKTDTELDMLVDNFNKMESIIHLREEELRNKNEELKIKTSETVKANRLKSEFLSNISHELKTPLNSIIGFTNRVIKKSSNIMPKAQLENLMIVRDQAKHLLNLIENLLNYSIIEAGNMDVEIQAFNLVEVIYDVISNVNIFSCGKPIMFEQKFNSTTDMPIVSDKDKVKHILNNLLGNAFKYSEKGTVRLSVDMKDDKYYICIKDEGIGISRENLKIIFDGFRQVDGSTTRQAGGTGLGLPMSKSYAEMLGGEITVTSKLGNGSCFTLCLPTEYQGINQ